MIAESRKYCLNISFLIIIILGLIFWTGVVFYFSGQSGNESTEESMEVLHSVLHILTQTGIITACDYSPETLSNLNSLLRVAAHFSEYLILGSISGILLRQINKIINYRFYGKKMFLIPLVYVFVISLCDESMQYFTPDRSFQIIDMIVDMAGGVVGILLAALVYRRTVKLTMIK